jgi:hypothetical protein
MGIHLAPTFVNIILELTYVIDLLLMFILWSLVQRVRELLVDVEDVKQLDWLFKPERRGKLAVLRKKSGECVLWNRDRYVIIYVLIPVICALNLWAQIAVRRMAPSTSRVVLGTVVALVCGILLFTLKIRRQIIYGTMEAIFAVGSCAFSLAHMGENLTGAAFIGLISSIYLMIRAMDNIKKGLDERKKEKEGESKKQAHVIAPEIPGMV